jgi:hypothetical protein
MKTAERSNPQDNVTVAAMEVGAFFSLYGGKTRRSSRSARAASVAGTRGSASNGSNFYTAIIVGSAIVAAFGFGIIVRLGWHALVNGKGDPPVNAVVGGHDDGAPSRPFSPEPQPGPAERPSGASPGPMDGARRPTLSVELKQPDFLLRLHNPALRFADVTRRKERYAASRIDDRLIRYAFYEWQKSGVDMANGDAWILIRPSSDLNAFRLDVAGDEIELPSTGKYTCLFQDTKRVNDGEDPFALFDFEIMPTDD